MTATRIVSVEDQILLRFGNESILPGDEGELPVPITIVDPQNKKVNGMGSVFFSIGHWTAYDGFSSSELYSLSKTYQSAIAQILE